MQGRPPEPLQQNTRERLAQLLTTVPALHAQIVSVAAAAYATYGRCLVRMELPLGLDAFERRGEQLAALSVFTIDQVLEHITLPSQEAAAEALTLLTTLETYDPASQAVVFVISPDDSRLAIVRMR